MVHASRIVIIGLLALMQMIAPLVHAHASGERSPGFVHLPGLEFLAKQSRDVVQSSSDKASLDVIVGLAQGLKLKSEPVAPTPKLEYNLPGFSGVSLALLVFPESFFFLDSSPPHLQPAFSPASPRAPPLTTSAF